MYEYIEVKQEGRVATLTLNRPEVLNAISQEVAFEISAAVKDFDKDPSVGAVVIAGNGKHFCAGGDIRRMKELIDSKTYLVASRIKVLQDMVTDVRNCSKPVIGMIHGIATGGGCCLALACDFRFVAPSTKFGFAFINLGLPGDTGAVYLANRLIGPARTAKMMMTGELIGGEEAVSIGLATELVAEEELAEASYAFAKKLSQKSAVALAEQKKIINKYYYGQEMIDYFPDEQQSMVYASHQPDFTEGVSAFLEKRKPEFNK